MCSLACVLSCSTIPLIRMEILCLYGVFGDLFRPCDPESQENLSARSGLDSVCQRFMMFKVYASDVVWCNTSAQQVGKHNSFCCCVCTAALSLRMITLSCASA